MTFYIFDCDDNPDKEAPLKEFETVEEVFEWAEDFASDMGLRHNSYYGYGRILGEFYFRPKSLLGEKALFRLKLISGDDA